MTHHVGSPATKDAPPALLGVDERDGSGTSEEWREVTDTSGLGEPRDGSPLETRVHRGGAGRIDGTLRRGS